jgi:hypothetical protein
MLSFIVGIASIALLMGFMVGASSSPVAGVALTAGFGIVAASLTYLQSRSIGYTVGPPAHESTKHEKARAISVDNLNGLGRVLLIFSAVFSIGLGAGIWARSTVSTVAPITSFPWQQATAPSSARAAIDWLLVQRNLRTMGYSDAQIESIYQINLKAKKEESTGFLNQELLSSMFFAQKIDALPRNLLADQPPSDPSLFKRPFELPSDRLKLVPG